MRPAPPRPQLRRRKATPSQRFQSAHHRTKKRYRVGTAFRKATKWLTTLLGLHREAASDLIELFLAACVVDCPGDRLQSSLLHREHVVWCAAEGVEPLSNRGLSLKLAARGLRKKHSNNTYWLDIKLKTASDPPDPPILGAFDSPLTN
jgi:hypothetical protein